MNEYSKYVLLKSSLEDLFGEDAWYALKESNSTAVWKKYIEKVLKAIQISIHETVEICDEEWMSEIDKEIERGLLMLKLANSIDDAISVLAGSLIPISFLQIGYMPRRKGKSIKVSLKKADWKLGVHRSVMYVQTKDQKEKLFWGKQQKAIGFNKQIDVYNEYRRSKSKMPYSIWCAEREKD